MLLGSTEWAETHADELKKKARHLHQLRRQRPRLPGRRRQPLRCEHLVNQVAADVTDPQTGVSVAPARCAPRRRSAARAPSETKRSARAAADGKDLPIGRARLGLGLFRLPAASRPRRRSTSAMAAKARAAASTTPPTTPTSTTSASCDPGFAYGGALAKTAGRLVLRVADADLPPLQRFGDFADTVGRYVDEVKKLGRHPARPRRKTQAACFDAKAFAWPPIRPPLRPAQPRGSRAVLRLRPAGARRRRLKAPPRLRPRDSGAAPQLPPRFGPNARPAAAHGASPDLGRRPARPALVPAPGLRPRPLTGYGAKTLPAVREALEGRRWAEAQDQVARTAAVFVAASARIDEAAAALR